MLCPSAAPAAPHTPRPRLCAPVCDGAAAWTCARAAWLRARVAGHGLCGGLASALARARTHTFTHIYLPLTRTTYANGTGSITFSERDAEAAAALVKAGMPAADAKAVQLARRKAMYAATAAKPPGGGLPGQQARNAKYAARDAAAGGGGGISKEK